MVLINSTTTCHMEIAMMIPSFLELHVILNESLMREASS